MASNSTTFDYKEFKSSFENAQTLKVITDLLSRRDCFANLPAGALQPLTDRLEKLNMGNVQPPAAEFDFELPDIVTIDDVTRLCRDRRVDGVAAPVSEIDMTMTHINRVYYNDNFDIDNPNWVQCSRPEASDLNSEVAEMIFHDEPKKYPNWQASLPRLKALARARSYSQHQLLTSLRRMIARYNPDLARLAENMNANQAANFLIHQEKNRDSRSYRRKELYLVTRTPDQDLKAPVIQAMTIIDQLYPEDQPALAAYRSAAVRTAIVSFLPDILAIPLMEELKRASELCRPISDFDLLVQAQSMEDNSRTRPLFNLKYGRIINSVPASDYIQFNCTETQNVTGIPTTYEYGLPFRPIGSPYTAYHPFPPPEEDQLNYRPAQQAAQQGYNPWGALPGFAQPNGMAQQQPPHAIAPQLRPMLPQQPQQHAVAPVQQLNQREAENQLLQAADRLRADRAAQGQRIHVQQEAELTGDSAPVSEIGSDGSETSAESEDRTMRDREFLAEGETTPITPRTQLLMRAQAEARRKAEAEAPTPIVTSTPKGIRGRLPVERTVETRLSAKSANSSALSIDSINLEGLSAEQVELLSISLSRPKEAAQLLLGKRDNSYSRGDVKDSRYSSKNDDSSRGDRKRSVSYSRDRNDRQDRSRDKSRDRSTDRSQNRSRDYSSGNRSLPNRTDYRTRDRTEDRTERYRSRDRDTRFTRYSDRRQESRSPGRDRGRDKSPFASRGRPERSPSRDRYRDRNSSASERRSYPEMRKGKNCSLDYSPEKMRECSKCPERGHHEFDCKKYENWAPRICTRCGKYNHYSDRCEEGPKFPPNHNDNDRKN